MTFEARAALAQQVVRSQRRLPWRTINSVLEHHRGLEPRRLALKGRAKWLHDVKPWRRALFHHDGCPDPDPPPQVILSGDLRRQRGEAPEGAWDSSTDGAIPGDLHSGSLRHQGGEVLQGARVSSADGPPVVLPDGVAEHNHVDVACFLACPTCGHKAEASRDAFSLAHLDKKTWCKICKASRPVHNWRCACNLRWHVCPRHAAAPAQLRESKAPIQVQRHVRGAVEREEPSLRARRTHDPLIVQGHKRTQEWLDQGPSVAKRPCSSTWVAFNQQETDATRVLDPTSLGPKLKHRFAHLLADGQA